MKLIFGKNQGRKTHAEELSARSYREDICPPLLEHTKVISNSNRKVDCTSLLSEAGN